MHSLCIVCFLCINYDWNRYTSVDSGVIIHACFAPKLAFMHEMCWNMHVSGTTFSVGLLHQDLLVSKWNSQPAKATAKDHFRGKLCVRVTFADYYAYLLRHCWQNQNGKLFCLHRIWLKMCSKSHIMYAARRHALVDNGTYFGQVIRCRDSSVVTEMEGSTNWSLKRWVSNGVCISFPVR